MFPRASSPGNKHENSWDFVLNRVSCDWEGYTRVYLSSRGILSSIFPPRSHNKTDCVTMHTCNHSHSCVVLSLTVLRTLGSTQSDSYVALTKLDGDNYFHHTTLATCLTGACFLFPFRILLNAWSPVGHLTSLSLWVIVPYFYCFCYCFGYSTSPFASLCLSHLTWKLSWSSFVAHLYP